MNFSFLFFAPIDPSSIIERLNAACPVSVSHHSKWDMNTDD